MRTANYNNQMFKQLQEVMKKCDGLSQEIKNIKEEHKKEIFELEVKHAKEINKLNVKIENLEIEKEKLKEENKILKNDNDRMKSILNKDSSNSSIPPSKSEININNAQVNIKNVTTGEENITNIELQPNEKITLEANISPAFWCEEKVTWESADTSIAEINENGELTAKADGNTTITAKISGKSKTVNIKVENLETVQFDNPDMTIEKGSSTTLKIIGGVDEDSNITWKVKTMANPNKEYDINNIAIMRYLKVEKTSDNREVKVTSVDTEADNNKYQIIAYVDGTDYYGICDVTIGIPVDMIRIGPVSTGISISSNGVEESLEIDYNNEETKNFELALRLYPDNHTEEVPETVWTVEDPSVIQHNGNGKFTVLRGGTTVVTAKAGKYERKITITINGDTEHVLLGDVDQSGKVTATDGFLTYDIYLHEEELEPDVFTAADVDKSGKVTATDAFIIYDAYLHEIVL